MLLLKIFGTCRILISTSQTIAVFYLVSTSLSPTENDKGGWCELYRGGDTCLPHRANELVFVRGNTSQRVASKLSDEVDGINNIDPRCIEALCYVLFPACITSDDATESVPTISVASCQRMQDRCDDLSFHEAVVKKFLYSTSSILPRRRYEVPVSCCLPSTCRSATRFRDRSSRSADTCEGSESTGTPCAFPFTYFGVEYNECTDIALQYRGNRLWCVAKSASFDTHQQWVQCHCSGSTYRYDDKSDVDLLNY